MNPRYAVRTLDTRDLGLVAKIDRSELVEMEYTVVDGQLAERPVSMTEVPTWDPEGSGPFSVAAIVASLEPIVSGGATMLGAFAGEELGGLAVVDPAFEPSLSWLAFLHVSRPHRRRGVASALWDQAVALSVAADASMMYVSATPTGSAVGFYLSRGCVVADPVHLALYAEEPDDIHLVCRLRERGSNNPRVAR